MPGKFLKTYTLSALNDVTDWIEPAYGDSQILVFQAKGTGFTGTMTFQQTLDDTNTATALAVPSNSTTGATTATADGIYAVDSSGGRKSRIQLTAVSAGSVLITVGSR